MSVPPSRIESTSSALNILAVVTTMRSLFAEQLRWIGAMLYSVVYGLPDRDAITARLMRNAQDFANTFRQFYGDAFANRLELLLTGYYRTLIDLADAYKAGDMDKATTLHNTLYVIVDQLAPFLADRNRFWDATAIQVSLYELTQLIEQTAAAMFSGEYQQAIEWFDAAAEQALRVAEDLAYGLARQLQI